MQFDVSPDGSHPAQRSPRRGRGSVAGWVLLALIAGLATSAQAATHGSAGTSHRPPVVVAVLGEAGANVLHEEFQRNALVSNINLPPATSVTLPKSGSFESRLAAAQRGPLGHLVPGRLYRINGTNIVGVYNPVESSNPLTRQPPGNLFADREHGTEVLSAVAGKQLGTAPDVQVVIVLGVAKDGWQWVARQRWIDFVSTSYLQAVPGALHALQAICDAQSEVEAVNARGGIVFSANGNDPGMSALPPASFPNVYHVGGVDPTGRTVLLAPSTGAVTTVLSPERPYESGELFDFPAASPDSLTATTSFGATSGATPRMAGNAANLLAIARQRLQDTGAARADSILARASGRPRLPGRGPLADGDLTRSELVSLLHSTSTPHEPSPDTRYALEGFGAFDAAARRLASAVIQGSSAAPDRAPESTMDQAVRDARAGLWKARCAIP